MVVGLGVGEEASLAGAPRASVAKHHGQITFA